MPVETQAPAIEVGTRVLIEKGCKALDLNKYVEAEITEVQELGPEYSHQVRVTLWILSSFRAGARISLYARHKNRLGDVIINLNDGRPEHQVKIRRKAKAA